MEDAGCCGREAGFESPVASIATMFSGVIEQLLGSEGSRVDPEASRLRRIAFAPSSLVFSDPIKKS
jgi:hypothetical protein